MTNVCFYFQVHQPFRLKKFRIFDIGESTEYFDDQKNKEIMEKVAKKCYLPANKMMQQLIRKHRGKFRVSYSITGTAIEQFKLYAPKVLDSFKELADTGCVEFMSETNYHSLAYLHDKKEFKDQVSQHYKTIRKLFKQKPVIFRNTELVYNNELAKYVEDMGYKGILAEGWEHYLGWRSPNHIYRPKTTRKMKVFLKNYKLSDDIAFRFSNKGWNEYPLTVKKYADWITPIMGDSVNLFVDYETFGEHQWEDTGIFKFMKALPSELIKRGIKFHQPSELLKFETKDELDVHNFLSWADVERDLSAWLGNRMQTAAAERLYALKADVMASKDKELIETWKKMTTSDHLYYMCTKWFNDGDVHKYFNPYNTPYDCFIAFMNILNDMVIRLKAEEKPAATTQIRKWIKV